MVVEHTWDTKSYKKISKHSRSKQQIKLEKEKLKCNGEKNNANECKKHEKIITFVEEKNVVMKRNKLNDIVCKNIIIRSCQNGDNVEMLT